MLTGDMAKLGVSHVTAEMSCFPLILYSALKRCEVCSPFPGIVFNPGMLLALSF